MDLNGGADYTDIQSAIDAAADGDTVLVKPGEYVITEPIDFNRLHDPDESREPAGEEHRREVGGRGGGDDDPDVGDAGESGQGERGGLRERGERALPSSKGSR